MKLLIVVVLASCLLVKIAQGQAPAAGATGGACKAGDVCDAATDVCTNNVCLTKDGETCSGNDKCVSGKCSTNCLKSSFASCTAKAECAIDACSNGKCGKKDGDACTSNADCASANCKLDTATKKETCGSGAAAIVASLLLMLSAALTSHLM